MPAAGGSRISFVIFYPLVVTATAVSIFLSGPPVDARAAVLEQLDDGMIVPHEKASTEMPSGDAPASGEQGPRHARTISTAPLQWNVADEIPARASTSVILDIVRRRERPFELGKNLTLPQPRRLPPLLSLQQRRMRELAIVVGHRFAGSPAVARAKLDRSSFVSLFAAMIHRESNFNTWAVSPAGAKGLGQLMPGTARDLGVCDVFSPRDNLNGAATYFTAMLEQFGSPAMALAAYNAGPAAVARYRGIPPFRETRQYVADIINATDQGSPVPSANPVDALAYQIDDTGEPSLVRARLETVADPSDERPDCKKRPRASTVIDG